MRCRACASGGRKRSPTPLWITLTESSASPVRRINRSRVNSEIAITWRARRTSRGSMKRYQRANPGFSHSG